MGALSFYTRTGSVATALGLTRLTRLEFAGRDRSAGQPRPGVLMTAPATSETIEPEGRRLRDLSSAQWKSGLAAWLGWLFDGLDMHLYTLVASPFVAALLGLS